MALQFNKSLVIGGNEWKTEPFKFYGKNDIWNIGGGAPEPTWQDVILSGNTALTLVNAKADGLNYVKLFGECELSSLITNDNYTQYLYLRNGSSAKIDTGFCPTVDDIVFDIRFYCNGTSSMYLWESRDTTSSTMIGIGGAQSNSTITLYNGSSTGIVSNISRTNGHVYHVIGTLKNGNATLYVKDETDNIEDTVTGTYTFGANETNMYFFGNENQYVGSGFRIYSAKCWYQGSLVQYWLPAGNSEDVYGLYNIVNNTFITSENTFLIGAVVKTPSQDHPLNIVCNNGILKLRNKNGLPSGYIQLNYLACTGTQYVTTSYYPNTNTEYSTKIYVTANNVSPFGARWSGSPTYDTFGAVYSTTGTLVLYYGRYNSDEYYTFSSSQIAKNTEYNLSLGLNKITFNNTDYSITRSTFVSTEPLTLGALNINGTAGNLQKGRIYPLSISENGESVTNLIPCRRVSDSVLGIYDTSTNTFLTNEGTGTFTAGDVDYSDYELYTDGVTETVNIHNKNIWSNSKTSVSGVGYTITGTDYGFIATAGASTGNSSRAVIYLDSDFFKENTTYVISGIDGYKSVYVGRTVDGTNDNGYYKNGGSGRYFTITDIAEGQTRFIISIYLGTKDKGFEFDFSQIQIEEGTSSTEYEIPFNGGTATTGNLYGVYSYNDEQNITTGAITRKTYAITFDGTEDWSLSKNGSTYRYNFSLRANGYPDPYTPKSQRGHIISTHFTDIGGTTAQTLGGAFTYSNIYLYVIPSDQTITTAAGFKAWLAQQKAEGTPLIVLYERNTAKTETVTPQSLTTQQGTNIIEITEASIDGLPLEVSYKAGVTVTVEEIENVNLDNEVTVTIGE